MNHLWKIIQVLRIGGAVETIRILIRELLRRLHSSEIHWAMAYELEPNREANGAARPIRVRPMKPSDTGRLYGFTASRPDAGNLRTILEHLLFLDADIPTPYVGVNAQDCPVAICWYITSDSNRQLRRYFGEGLPVLTDDEVLLEFIYTRPDCRGQHLMYHLTQALFSIGRQDGMRRAHAYINTANTASLAGCRRIGWKPRVVKQLTWRWFRRRIEYREMKCWAERQDPSVPPRENASDRHFA